MSNDKDTACPAGDHLDAAPTLFECPACRFLTPEPRFADGTLPCPECHKSTQPWQVVPADRLRRFDERIRHHHRSGDSEVVVILVATFLETVMEDLLARMMEAQGSERTVVALVLDTERSVGRRIGKLFPTLSGAQFEDIAAELGYRDFPHRWRQMRSARNAFIHGESFDGPRETLDNKMACEAMQLLDQAYELFVLMNNRYVAQRNARTGRD